MRTTNDASNSPRPLRLAVAAAVVVCLSAPVLAGTAVREASKLRDTKTTMEASGTGRVADSVKTAKPQAAERKFLDSAIAISERDLAAARLARERSVDAKVRVLAEQLERDHQGLLGELDATAVALGLDSSRSYDAGVAMGAETDGMGKELAGAASGGSIVGGTPVTGSGTAGGGTATKPSAMPSKSQADKLGRGGEYGEAGKALTSRDPQVQALAKRSGADFDRAFLDQIVVDHERSVAEFSQTAADRTLSQRVRSLASQSLPTLRDDLATARTLRISLEKSAAQ